MKFILSLFLFCALADTALAASGRGRVSMVSQMMTAPRAVVTETKDMTSKSSLAVTPEIMYPAPKVDSREDEREACLINNVGVGNTFVWASRYSNTDNYSMMLEDTENPENNTCFVRVELKSRDPNINVSDFQSKYFELGKNIKCAEWVNEEDLQQRILDAKKSKRAWATVGGAVGGAAVGVGAMELFGNKLIGGKVEGQKGMAEERFIISNIHKQKKQDSAKYNAFVKDIKELKESCDKNNQDELFKSVCEKYKYLMNEFAKTETTES